MGIRGRDKQLIYFLHVFKTGGTSIYSLLDQYFSDEELIKLYAKFSDKSFYSQIKKLIQSTTLPPTAKIVYGHIPFGAHKEFHTDGMYLAMVRNPLHQYLSAFNDTMTRKINTTVMKGVGNLDDFISDPFTWNMQSYFFTGIEGRILAGTDKKKVTELIRTNIDKHFKYVGLYEDFNASLKKLLKIADTGHRINPKDIPWINKSLHFKNKFDLSDKTIKKINAINEADAILYDYVKTKFHSSFYHKFETAFFRK